MENAEANDPADPMERIDPAEPIDKIDPAEPIDKIDPAEPIDRIDPADPMLRIDPAEPFETFLDRIGSFSQRAAARSAPLPATQGKAEGRAAKCARPVT